MSPRCHFRVKYSAWQIFLVYIMIKYFNKLVVCLLLLGLCGCSGVNFSEWRFPYMMEVTQGTYINIEQYKQLKVGMNKDQVATILGYPLTQYMFDQNRWDFMYQNYKNNRLAKSYIVTLYFNKDAKITNIASAGKIFPT